MIGLSSRALSGVGIYVLPVSDMNKYGTIVCGADVDGISKQYKLTGLGQGWENHPVALLAVIFMPTSRMLTM